LIYTRLTLFVVLSETMKHQPVVLPARVVHLTVPRGLQRGD